MTHSDFTSSDILKGALAGGAAGLVASYAMDRFQAAVTALSRSKQGGEPATQKAADKVANAATGHLVPKPDKPLAGQAVHYGLGTALCTAYGVMAEVYPAATAGAGSAFGLAVAAVLDEAVVPAVGLGEAPWNTAPSAHAYTGSSHLVFGVAAELTRRFVRGALG